MKILELTLRLQKAKDHELLAFHDHLILQENNKFVGYELMLNAVENEILTRNLLDCNQWDEVQLSKEFGLV